MTAGYSGTPLVKKLGIREGDLLVTIRRPANYLELIADAPDEVSVMAEVLYELWTEDLGFRIHPNIIHIFVNQRQQLFEDLARCRKLIDQDGSIWVSWYKKAAKLPTEITEDTIREAAFPLGLVDIKVCAVDDKWSGLKLVIRKENRL